MSDTESIAERLDAIAEELGDLAMTRLREAIAGGSKDIPEEERRLTRARRSVEKAAALLRVSADDV
jgi:hypothetical protein